MRWLGAGDRNEDLSLFSTQEARGSPAEAIGSARVIATSISRRFSAQLAGKMSLGLSKIVRQPLHFPVEAPRRLVQRNRREILVAPRLGSRPRPVIRSCAGA